MPHRGLAGNVCASATLSLIASKDLASSQYRTIQLQLFFDIIGFPICFLCLKHPFRTTITLSATSTAPLLISGVFNCCSLPHHLKAPWYLQDFGLLHPHCPYLQIQVYLHPSPNQSERISSLHLLYFRQLFSNTAALHLCSSYSKKCLFSSLFTATLVPVLVCLFIFFLIMLYWQHLHFIPKHRSMSWERIPSCDNRATSSTMESPHSLFLERAFPSPQSRYKVTPTPPKAGFSFVLKGLASQLRFQAYLSG